MNLRTYFDEKPRGAICAMAREIGVDQSMIHHIMSGRSRATVEVAAKIERATNGAVTASELLDHLVPEGYELRRKGECCPDHCAGGAE